MTCCGIDVGKDKLDVSLPGKKDPEVIENRDESCQKMANRLSKLKVELVVLEATGGYEQRMVTKLHEAGVPVAVINPQRSWAYAKSLGNQAKTDKIDAKMLRTFGETQSASLRRAEPPSAERKILKELEARRAQLKRMVAVEKNHLAAPLTTKLTKVSILNMITVINEEVEALESQMNALIESDKGMKEIKDVIQKENGCGDGMTYEILANLPELGRIKSTTAAALVGVAPFADQSSLRDGSRKIKGGREPVRSMLFMATRSARLHNKPIRAYYKHLITRGKPRLVAQVACMRKFIRILNGKLRDHYAAKEKNLEAGSPQTLAA